VGQTYRIQHTINARKRHLLSRCGENGRHHPTIFCTETNRKRVRPRFLWTPGRGVHRRERQNKPTKLHGPGTQARQGCTGPLPAAPERASLGNNRPRGEHDRVSAGDVALLYSAATGACHREIPAQGTFMPGAVGRENPAPSYGTKQADATYKPTTSETRWASYVHANPRPCNR